MKIIPALASPLVAVGTVSAVHAQSIGSKVSLSTGQAVTYDGLLFDVATNHGTPTINLIGTGRGNTRATAIAKGDYAQACNKRTKANHLDTTIKMLGSSGKTSTVAAFTNAITGNVASAGLTSMVYCPATTLPSAETTTSTATSPCGQIAVANGLKRSTAAGRVKGYPGLTTCRPGVLAFNTNRLNLSLAPEPAATTLLVARLTGLTIARHRHARMRDGIADVRASHIL